MGEAENSATELGIARIWKVYIFHKLVDTYGETPYFGAGKGFLDSNFRPSYDSVESIYMDMLKELEEGVAQIAERDERAPSQDFGGDGGKEDEQHGGRWAAGWVAWMYGIFCDDSEASLEYR